MSNIFISRTYNRLLAVTVVTATINYLPRLVDSLVAGNIVGEQALAAIDIVSPLFMLPFMAFLLFIPGLIMQYTMNIGKADVKRAEQFFSLSVELVVGLGILLALLAYILREPYFYFMGVHGEALTLARQYYTCVIGHLAVQPLCLYLNELLLVEGQKKLAVFPITFQITMNTFLSFTLARTYGIAGIGLATTISSLLIPVIIYLAYLRKVLAQKFAWYFSKEDVQAACKYGFVDFFITVIYAASQYLISSYILRMFGNDILIVWAVVLLVYDLFAVLTGICEAFKPLHCLYKGENNELAIRLLMKHAVNCALVVAGGLSVLLFFIAPFMGPFFGMTLGSLLPLCTRACRWMCLGTLSYALIELFSNYYLNDDEYLLAATGNSILYLASFLGGPLLLSFIWGVEGVFVGFAEGILFSPFLFLLVILARKGKAGSLLYLQGDTQACFLLGICLGEQEIQGAVLQIEAFLRKKAVDAHISNRIQLIVEELSQRTLEKNPGRKVYAEYFINLGDTIRLIIKDTGHNDDLTKGDNELVNFRSYFLAQLMNTQLEKIYFVAYGYNRSIYDFPWKKEE